MQALADRPTPDSPDAPPVLLGLGEALRGARSARGLLLDDVEGRTHIPRRYLEALEAGDGAALPDPVYARGFLRSYARVLGLDADALVRRFLPPSLHRAEPSPWRTSPQRRQAAPASPVAAALVGAGLVAILALTAAIGVSALGGGDGDAPAGGGSLRSAGGQSPDGGRVLPLGAPSGLPTRTVDVERTAVAPGTRVPDVLGVPLNDAIAQLRGIGLPYMVVLTAGDGGAARGRVVQQSPPPATKAGSRTAVTLVASGPLDAGARQRAFLRSRTMGAVERRRRLPPLRVAPARPIVQFLICELTCDV